MIPLNELLVSSEDLIMSFEVSAEIELAFIRQ